MYIDIGHKEYLVLFVVLPLIVFLHFYSLKNIKSRSLKFANFDAIYRIKGIDIYSKGYLALWFNLVFVTFLILSLAKVSIVIDKKASSFSYVVAIDNSQSMTADDIVPDRLTAAKMSAISFIELLPKESYVGVVSFSGASVIESEITRDKAGLKRSIEEIEVSEVMGTDVFEAVYNSGTLLQNREPKAVVLISDGQINVGKIKDIIDFARSEEVIVHTFGIGSEKGGEAVYGLSKIDEDSLRSLAYSTGGRYYKVNDAKKLDDSFKDIMTVTRKLSKTDLTPYLLFIMLIIFIARIYLENLRKLVI